jgi:hypothetical protein
LTFLLLPFQSLFLISIFFNFILCSQFLFSYLFYQFSYLEITAGVA